MYCSGLLVDCHTALQLQVENDEEKEGEGAGEGNNELYQVSSHAGQ